MKQEYSKLASEDRISAVGQGFNLLTRRLRVEEERRLHEEERTFQAKGTAKALRRECAEGVKGGQLELACGEQTQDGVRKEGGARLCRTYRSRGLHLKIVGRCWIA